ncbi:hypothetical protein QBC39DRAFT_327803 [Podospora conica]|nr:hypothetical protein QBC39DRAFT_327803 [Schizothecium conicum]
MLGMILVVMVVATVVMLTVVVVRVVVVAMVSAVPTVRTVIVVARLVVVVVATVVLDLPALSLDEIEQAFRRLTRGLDPTTGRTVLDHHLGILDTLQSDTALQLSPGATIDATTVDICLRYFAMVFQKVAVIPTWIQGKAPTQFPSSVEAVLWPFHIEGRFILVVIRPNHTVQAFEPFGNLEKHFRTPIWEETRRSIEAAGKLVNGWKAQWNLHWTSLPLHSVEDSGIFCIANAAYTIAGHRLPYGSNFNFWRIACRSLMGFANTNEELATSKLFAHLHGCSQDAVSKALRETKDKTALAMLRTLVQGMNEEEHYLDNRRGRREHRIQLAAVERLKYLLTRMETLDEIVPAIMDMGGATEPEG